MASPDASSLSSQRSKSEAKALSPLAQRLVMALRHLASEHDELTMVVRGFERYMRRTGLADDVIRDGLLAIKDHVDKVLAEPATDADNADAVHA